MSKILLDFIDGLNKRSATEGAWAYFVEFSADLGAIQVNYVSFSNSDILKADMSVQTTKPDWWYHRYNELGGIWADHSVEHALNSFSPMITGHKIAKNNDNVKCSSKRILSEIREIDIHTLMSCPIHSTMGHTIAGISFSTSLELKEFNQLMKSYGTTIHAACLALHEHTQRSLIAKETESYAISSREREVLAWLAAGERPSQIAFRLGIKEVTARLHIHNAKSKLGVCMPEQAVVKAISLGIIQP